MTGYRLGIECRFPLVEQVVDSFDFDILDASHLYSITSRHYLDYQGGIEKVTICGRELDVLLLRDRPESEISPWRKSPMESADASQVR